MFNITRRKRRGRTAEQIHQQQRAGVARSAQDLREPMASALFHGLR